MDVRILLVLLIGIVIMLAIAFYISTKQNRALKKKLIKQEPQLNYHSSFVNENEENPYNSSVRIQNLDKSLKSREGEEIFWQNHDSSHTHPKASSCEILDERAASSSHLNTNPLQDSPQTKPEIQRSVSNPLLNKEIIYLMVLAPNDRPHSGYELLQSLLSAGLRYGPMNIFHRFEDTNGRGKILFSVASIEEPGTFEISKMGAYTGKGLMMFLRFSSGKDLSAAFEIMLDTAKQLTEDLGGQILDDEKQVLTPDKIEKSRKKIADFEQKQLIPDLFD